MKRTMKQGDYCQFASGTRCKIIAVYGARFSAKDKGRVLTYLCQSAVTWSEANQAWVKR